MRPKRKNQEVAPFINPFEHKDFGKVRVAILDGEPWFYASDVAKALGYSNPRDAIKRHCKKVKSLKISVVASHDGTPQPNIMPESDVYRLVARSHKAEAEAFMDWLYEDVLPTLRKTGTYGAAEPAALPGNSLPKITDNFFQDILPVFRSTRELCEEVGYSKEDATVQAFRAIKTRYGIDLAEYTDGVNMLHRKYRRNALQPNNGNGQAKLYDATDLGLRLNPPLKPRQVNIALESCRLLQRNTYEGKDGTEKWRWRLTKNGKTYGREFEVGKRHSDGEPILNIKWYEDVLDFLDIDAAFTEAT